LGIILGSALNNDGPRTSFGSPNGEAQRRLFLEALADASVAPHQVNLIEVHGTGTAVGGKEKVPNPTKESNIGNITFDL